MEEYKSESITAKDVLSFTKGLNIPIFVSCFTPEYTKRRLDLGDLAQFEQVVYLGDNSSRIELVYSFDKRVGLTTKDFESIHLDKILEMDVEDGFVYSDVSEMYLTKDALVFL